jgi:hypothetical protein
VTTKHTPATPLPWKPVSERANEGMGAPVETELRGADLQVAVRLGKLYSDRQKQDAAYITHAANAYPKQIIAALELLEALDREHGDELGVDTAAAANRLSALLRELGEDA